MSNTSTPKTPKPNPVIGYGVVAVLMGILVYWTVGVWHDGWLQRTPPMALLALFTLSALKHAIRHWENHSVLKVFYWMVSGPEWVVARLVRTNMVVGGIFIVAMLVFAAPVFLWELLEWAAVKVPAKVYAYLSLVASSLILTVWGQKVSVLLDKWTGKSHASEYLTSKHIKVYIYGLMILTYVVANVENFSDWKLTEAVWWTSYKDVLLEVLLTYTAMDSGLTVLRELQTKKG